MPNGGKNHNGCRLYEIEQFICDYSENDDIKVKCYPLPRIFYECPNRPVYEITSLVTIDAKTGELVIPDNLDAKLPTGKLWRDVEGKQT